MDVMDGGISSNIGILLCRTCLLVTPLTPRYSLAGLAVEYFKNDYLGFRVFCDAKIIRLNSLA